MSQHDVINHQDTEHSPARRWVVSVFGDITRAGSWPPHATTTPVAIFGDIDLDLRHATLQGDAVRINAIAPFGNIDVIVPTGAQVDVGGITVFGSKRITVEGAKGSDPNVRLRGYSLFGSLKVRSS